MNMLRATGVGALLAAAIVGAAPAHADTLSFLTDVKAAGFAADVGANAGLIQLGRYVCTTIAGGAPPEAVAEYIFTHSQLDNLDSARQFVTIAQNDLCTITTPGTYA
jgi:hypothetical protein